MSSGASNQTVFFGSGPVAARSLELLCEHTPIEAVVTKPRPVHHRGSVPVLELAEARGLPIFTVSNKSELDTLLDEQNFTSHYGTLIDFGIIISQTAINHFPSGIINSHFSLLPKLRGADPITWTIINGDEKTGVSLMLIDQGMDTGKILTQKTLRLNQTETTPVLTKRLIDLSDQLIRDYIPRYIRGEISPRAQPHPSRATYSRKINKDDGMIDWTQPAEAIERRIRAFIEWPQSRTKLGDLDIIITDARVIERNGTPGEYTVDDKCLIVYAGRQALTIDSLKPLNKKEMPIQAFLAGYSSHLLE